MGPEAFLDMSRIDRASLSVLPVLPMSSDGAVFPKVVGQTWILRRETLTTLQQVSRFSMDHSLENSFKAGSIKCNLSSKRVRAQNMRVVCWLEQG